MDKENQVLNAFTHCVNINDRKSLSITGVKKIDSFDDEEFLIDTVMGYLAIKGSELSLIKLDSIQGNANIKGLIKSFTYVEDGLTKTDKSNGLIGRLFK